MRCRLWVALCTAALAVREDMFFGFFFKQTHTHTKRFERWGRLLNGRFLISSSRQRVESKISRARFFYICVFFSVGTLGLLPHYSVYKEMHTLTTQGLDAHSHDLRLHHFAFCSLFFWTRKMSALWRWDGDMGWAKKDRADFFKGCRPRCASGLIVNSQWCQMFYEQSTTFNLFLVRLLLPSLCTFVFYLFKAEIYGSSMEGRTNVTVDGNHRLLFYSSIFVYSRDLFCLSFSVFFFLNK